MTAILPVRPFQRDAIDAADALLTGGEVNRVTIVMATGLGKGHPLDTEVPTPDGLRLWGDLEPGDRVFGSDGAPTEVTAVFDRGTLPAYRVTFTDGTSVEVDGDHLWNVRERRRTPFKTLSTAEIAAGPLRKARGYQWQIPMVGRVHYRRADLPLDPYVVGALIANGGMTGAGSGTILTTPDPAVAELVGYATACRKINDTTDVCDRYSLPGLVKITESLGMRVRSEHKRIPRTYLTASGEQRVGLLHGLMDGDGSARPDGRRSVVYHTRSAGLATDVAELVTSLGGTASIHVYDRGPKGTDIQVMILLPSGLSAFRTGHKLESVSARNLQPRRSIVSIEPVGDKPIRCITVDAEDSLYLITRNHIVTHNTRTFCTKAAEFVAGPANAGKRVLILVHTDELTRQTARTLLQVAPGLDVGVVKADENEVSARVIVASVATLRVPGRKEQLRKVGLIIVDECHHASARSYQEILRYFGSFITPFGTPTIGVTATLARGDGASLAGTWQAVAFARDISWGIRHRYLIPPIGRTVRIPDLTLTRSVLEDDHQLGDALATSLAPAKVAEAYLEHCAGRRGLGFTPDIASAYVFAEAFTAAGIPSAVVHGHSQRYPMTQDERDLILKRHRAGDVTVVFNCAVLTEGYDDPGIGAVIMLRPTQSKPLYQQIVGRGLRVDPLRPHEGQDCVILAAVPLDSSLTLRTLVDLSDRPLPEAVDGKTLTQMEDEYDLGQGMEDPEHHYAGAVEVVEFDPLMAASSKAWKRTKGGTMVLPAGKHAYVFLLPGAEPGTFTVAWCTSRGRPFTCHRRMHDDECTPMHGKSGAVTEHRDLPADLAMAWAEDVGLALGFDPLGTYSAKDAAWRKGIPSEEMTGFALKLGIDPAPYLRGADRRGGKAGRLSDEIDRVFMTHRVDPIAARWLAGVR